MSENRTIRRVERGGCPACATTIAFGRATLGRGKTFSCKACRATLFIPKVSAGIVIAGYGAVSAFFEWAPLPVSLAIFAAAFVIDWLTVPVHLVPGNKPDTESTEAPEPVNSASRSPSAE